MKQVIRQIMGKTYEVTSLHPDSYQYGMYSVLFHEKDKPYQGKHLQNILIKAINESDAIEQAIKEIDS